MPGYLDRKTFIKQYSTEWLFQDSRAFLYSHLPEYESNQYYAPVLTKEEFQEEPYITGKFFQYGLFLVDNLPKYNNSINGEISIDVGLKNKNTALTSQLRTPSGSDINGASWENKNSSIMTINFDVPDQREYEGNIYARSYNEYRPLNKISSDQYEKSILPNVNSLYNPDEPKESKISLEELDFFKDSYFKVDENRSYYYLEDQFDTPRYNAVMKVHGLLDLSTDMLESVLNFNITADNNYIGYGIDSPKYPLGFSTYNYLTNTELLSPVKGILEAGKTERFVIKSTNYSYFAIIIEDEWNYFTRSNVRNEYELTLQIPEELKSLVLYGSSSKSGTYRGLISYDINF